MIGKDVPGVLLELIVDLPEPELRRSLTSLQAGEFLYETRLFPDHEYTFKHALTHEVAYQSLLQARRQTLHARIVDALERLYAERRAEYVEPLADHARRAEAWGRAVPYLREAANRAYGRCAYQEAATRLEQALEALAQLPDTPETLGLGVDLRLELRNCLVPLGRQEDAFQCVHDAESLAERLADRSRLGWVYAYLTQHFAQVGQPDRAVAAAARAHDLAAEGHDARLMRFSAYMLGLASVVGGSYAPAAQCFRESLGAGDSEPPGSPTRWAPGAPMYVQSWLAFVLGQCGEFVEARRRGGDALRVADGEGQLYALAVACWALGHVLVTQGEAPLAISVLERGLEVCRTVNTRLYETPTAAGLALAYSYEGREAEAVALLQPLVDAPHAVQTWARSQALVALGTAYLAGKWVTEAELLGRKALDHARARRDRGGEASALWLLGEAGDRGVSNQAEDNYREALDVATELGMRPLVAHCHLGLGKLYRRTGDTAKTEEHLGTARAMYREMGMTFWLEKAQGKADSV